MITGSKLIAFSILAFSPQKDPGPVDAFMANYSSVKADIAYEVTAGVADYSRIRAGEILNGVGFEFSVERLRTQLCTWSCDGETERIRSAPLVKDVKEYPKWGSGILNYIPPFDLLFDGQRAAFISNIRDLINVSDTDAHPNLVHGKTPFFRWYGKSLASVLSDHFPDVVPKRHRRLLSGLALEVEVYEAGEAEKWRRLEIAYDPSVGYLPRFARFLSSMDASRQGVQVLEHWLISTKQCAKSGGFVPMEWYEFWHTFGDFKGDYPNYNDETFFKEEHAKGVQVVRFKAEKFNERSRPCAFDDIKSIRLLGTFGGRPVPVSAGLNELTLAQINEIARRSSRKPTGIMAERQLPNSVDRQEIEKFSEANLSKGQSKSWIVLLTVALLVSVGVYRYRERFRTLLHLCAVVAILTGCQGNDAPVVKLSAALDQSRLICRRKTDPVDLKLRVRNAGTVPVRVLRIDGGCSCRRVDATSLPRLLKVGEEMSVAVTAQLDPEFAPRAITFGIETDHGLLGATVSLLAVPAHYVEPNYVSNNNLIEDEKWQFEIKYTETFKRGSGSGTARIKLPHQFVLSHVESPSEAAELDGYPGVLRRETIYHIAARESKDFGLRKDAIRFEDAAGQSVLEIPVVSKRSPFVTSSPDRISLGDRPLRVFLRCPNPDIEFTQVMSAPEGIKAFVSAPREVTVVVQKTSAPTISGILKIGTTAPGQPALEIPIVRYAPDQSS